MYGGDNYTERIIFLCPTTTRNPTFIGQFIDTDMDELVTERIMERARNLISALIDQRAEHSSWRDERTRQDRDVHEAMQKEAAEKQQLLHAQEENQDGRAEEEMLHVDAEKKKMDERAEKIRQARKRRLPSEPGGGTKIFIRTLSGEKLQRAFDKTALFQEVYDWAGSLPGMPLYFTLQRGATTVRHTDPLGSDEVLNICERDETEMAEFNMSEVTFRGNVGEAEEDFSQTLEDARLSNDASEAQQVDGTNKSEKNAADHQNMTDVNENSQTSQPGLLVKQKATQSAADKSTTSDHDAQRDTSQENVRQTESLVKDTSQSNDTSNQQKADGTDNSGKKAKYDESRPDGNKENQAGQPGLVDKQKEKENTCDKSTSTDAKRDTSRANKQKTESPDKDARQSNDARKRQKVYDANIPGKNARDDEGRPDKDNENQAGQPGPVDKQKEKENACDKSTATDTQKDTTMATKQ